MAASAVRSCKRLTISSLAGELAGYTYLGAGTIAETAHAKVSGGLNLTYGSNGDYNGLDRFGRVVDPIWETDAESILDGYHYHLDAIGNRTSKDNMVASNSLNLDQKYADLVLNRGVGCASNQSKTADPFECS